MVLSSTQTCAYCTLMHIWADRTIEASADCNTTSKPAVMIVSLTTASLNLGE